MNRWISWILAVVLVLGCGGMAFSVQAEAVGPGERVMARLTGGGDAGQTGADPAGTGAEIERGVIDGSVYENASLDIGCAVGDDWSFYSAEKLAEVNGTAREMLENTDLADLLENTTTFTEMLAQSEDQMLLVGILLEDISGNDSLDEAGYAELAMGTLESSLSSLGLQNPVTEQTTFYLAGQERPAIRISGVLQGMMNFYQTQVYLKRGDYMVIVMLQSMMADYAEDLADCFYILSEGPAEGPVEGPVEGPTEPDVVPVHFIDAMGDDGTYAYIDMIGISDWIFQHNGDTYYAAEDESYLYIVVVSDDQLAEMEEEQVYWERDEDSEDPPVYYLTGIMGTIDQATRDAFKEVFDIDDADFDYYFGDYYLDATLSP